MNKLFLLQILALTAMTAAPAMNQVPAMPGAKVVMYFRVGVDSNEQHEMVLAYNNVTKSKAKVTFEIFSPGGQLTPIPYAAVGGGVTRLDRVVQECEPLASGVLTTSSKGDKLFRGWLRVTSEPAGAVTVLAHGRTAVGGAASELKFSLHPQVGRSVQIMGPFDDGTTDHFLVANNSTVADRLTLVARDRQGGEMCRAVMAIGAGQYYKQHLKNYLPCTAGKTATLEVQSDTGATAAMVFIYPASGAAIPVEPKAGNLTLPEKVKDVIEELKRRVAW